MMIEQHQGTGSYRHTPTTRSRRFRLRKGFTALAILACILFPADASAAGPCAEPQGDVCVGESIPEFDLGTPPRYPSNPDGKQAGNPVVYFFWGDGCSRCEEEKAFFEDLSRKHPSMEIRSFEVWHSRDNQAQMRLLLKPHGIEAKGVPVTIVGGKVFNGFSERIGREIAKSVEECINTVCPDPAAGMGAETLRLAGDNVLDIPLLGKIDLADLSLPVTTVVVAGMDSFNPCAFFVLLSLLGILVYARSKSRMLLVGGVFVFFSGFLYFLFMAAWLNLFLFMDRMTFITLIAGVVSTAIALVNIKDFFAYRRGVSLTMSQTAKARLFDRMRRLVRSSSMTSVLLGTAALAMVANSYELLCTAGFPMVFTRVLTLHKLPAAQYYLYLVLYNVVYMIPLAVIVGAFSLTLGRWKLTERQGRVLKLVSGTMMLALGLVLIIKPSLMNNVFSSFMILSGSVALTAVVAWLWDRLSAQS